MKEERKLLVLTATSNILIGIIKLVGGVLFHVNALLVDSIYTFSDSITDIIALVGSKIAQKRANKRHPYGFGRAEYIANLFIGIILFLVGGYLFLHSFKVHKEIVSIWALVFILLALLIKIWLVKLMKDKNKKIKSPIIEENIEESGLDVLSSIFIGVVILLLTVSDKLPILKYADMIASVAVSLLIFKTAYPILKDSILDLIGEVEENEEMIGDIKKILTEINIPVSKISLMQYGRYYGARIEIIIDKNCTLKQAKNMQLKMIKRIKTYKKGIIKDVDVNFDIQ